MAINGWIGCGTCVQSCPTDVIRSDERTGTAAIRYGVECRVCHLCRM